MLLSKYVYHSWVRRFVLFFFYFFINPTYKIRFTNRGSANSYRNSLVVVFDVNPNSVPLNSETAYLGMDFYLFPNESTISALNIIPNATLGYAMLNYSSLDGAYNGYSLIGAGFFSSIQFEKTTFSPQFSSSVIEEFSPVSSSAPISQVWASVK